MNFENFPYLERAIDAHESTNQKYDDKGYGFHITSTFMEALMNLDVLGPDIMEQDDANENVHTILFAASFHDAIEDARLTYNDVLKIANEYMKEPYSTMAADIVYACTNEKGKNRDERENDKYFDGICSTKYAWYVKLCDRMANYKYSKVNNSRMLDIYERHMDEFLGNIGVEKDIYEKFLMPKDYGTIIYKLKEYGII